jgi:hypothetical protein
MDINQRFIDFASDLSDSGLQMLHKAVRDAFDMDERTQSGAVKPYGVRIHNDWKKWSDALESELTDRNIAFEPVPW